MLVMCPKGDDPVTINQNYRQIRISVDNSDLNYTGQIGIKFFGEISYLSLVNSTNTSCKDSLEASYQIGQVLCHHVVTESTTATQTFDVTFLSWPIYSVDNNLFEDNNGNPSLTDFYCDVSLAAASTSCTLSDIETADIRGSHGHVVMCNV